MSYPNAPSVELGSRSPFERRRFDVIAGNILDHITKGQITETFVYDRTIVKFALSHGPVKNIVAVTQKVDGETRQFQQDRDYRLLSEEGADFGGKNPRYLLEWILPQARTTPPGGLENENQPLVPREKSEFAVTYQLDIEPALTDGRVGSVLRCIIDATSREIEYAYLQLEKMYETAFLDTAIGNSLDLVVSILGVYREGGESDQDLRQKARRKLAILARATNESITWALRDPTLELKTDALVVEDPKMPGIIRIIVDGGNEENLNEVIRRTRAAGVFHEIVRASDVPCDVVVSAIVRKGTDPLVVEPKIKTKVSQFFSGRKINEAIVSSQLEMELLEIPGIMEVVEYFEKPRLLRDGSPETTEILPIAYEEKAVLRSVEVNVYPRPEVKQN